MDSHPNDGSNQKKRRITKLYLNPNEMAFRKIYRPLLEEDKITTIFRPGVRLPGMERAYFPGQRVSVRIIDYMGADWAGIPPAFVDSFSKLILIEKVYAKKIKELDESDFVGSSPDIFDRKSLIFHLGLVYNLFPEQLGEEEMVTIINFSYINMNMNKQNAVEEQEVSLVEISTLEEFEKSGKVKLAEKPYDNSVHYFLSPTYSASFVEHDYHAKTPEMWNAVYRAFEIPSAQAMFVGSTENIEEIFNVLRSDEKYLGGGLGVGFKDEAVAFLDEVDSIARKIGAVNVVVKNKAGKLVGHNTDGLGYAESLSQIFERRGQHIRGKKAVILGSGGTGSAIAFALAQRGMHIVILNRTVEKAKSLAMRINLHFGFISSEAVRFGGEEEISAEVSNADVVINVSTKGATGTFEKYLPLAVALKPADKENIASNVSESSEVFKSIPKACVISDVVLRDGDTPFIAMAKSLGFETLDGVPMVVNQGVEAMWLVHGKTFEKKGLSKLDVYSVMKNAAGF